MPTQKQAVLYRRRGTKGTLALHGPVGVFEAASLQHAALSALHDEKATTVRLDLGEALRLDVSALQILTALQRSVEADGRAFFVESTPASISASWLQIGYTL